MSGEAAAGRVETAVVADLIFAGFDVNRKEFAAFR